MLLTPLLSVSALAVPPLAKATHFQSSSNNTSPQSARHQIGLNRLPNAFRRVRQAGLLPPNTSQHLNLGVDDADDEDRTAAAPPWPPPPTTEQRLPATINVHQRWTNPITRSERDSKHPFGVYTPNNYNIKQESIARSSSSKLSRRVEHQNHLRDVIVPTEQQASSSRNHVLRGSSTSSLYSVKNQVSSHVSHSISHNYSYVMNSTVFVSNGFEVLNHTQPLNRSPITASRQPADQNVHHQASQFHVSSSKDTYPKPMAPKYQPSNTQQQNPFTPTISDDNDRVTDQSVLPDSVDQSKLIFCGCCKSLSLY